METYRQILSFFTTINITAEELYEEGKAQLDNFMPLVGLIFQPPCADNYANYASFVNYSHFSKEFQN